MSIYYILRQHTDQCTYYTKRSYTHKKPFNSNVFIPRKYLTSMLYLGGKKNACDATRLEYLSPPFVLIFSIFALTDAKSWKTNIYRESFWRRILIELKHMDWKFCYIYKNRGQVTIYGQPYDFKKWFTSRLRNIGTLRRWSRFAVN